MAKRKKNKQQQQQSQGPKRARRGDNDDDGPSFDASRGYIDPSSGQRGAFPGLENFDQDFYGPPADGIDYLRMVRSEAKGVPTLLLSAGAPPPPQVIAAPPPISTGTEDVVLDYDDATVQPEPEPKEPQEDAHYYFTDSTYISLHSSPIPPPLPPHHGPLLRSFAELRSRLHAKPPRQLAARPFPRWNNNKAWRDFVSTTFPQPSWMWSLQQWEVVRLLKDFTAWMEWRMRVRNAARRGVAKGWGVWIWGLLVRCERVMVAEDVSTVREMGKCALGMLVRMRGVVGDDVEALEGVDGSGVRVGGVEPASTPVASKPEGLEGGEEGPEGGEEEGPEGDQEEGPEGGEEEEEEEGEIVSAPPIAQKPVKGEIEFYSLEDTMGMLDVIVSIVGDFFGQRDLLEERATLVR